MTDKHFNAHRKNKVSKQIMLTTEEAREFDEAMTKHMAKTAKDLVLKLIRKS